MKICIPSSAGGHLTEVQQLSSIYKKRKHFFVLPLNIRTKIFSKKHKCYFIQKPGRNLLKFIPIIFYSFWILLREKPKVIITMGAGDAIPIYIIGKLFFNCKTIYIETLTRILTPSITGRILYFFSDLFVVQWKPLLKFFGKKAIYGGQMM